MRAIESEGPLNQIDARSLVLDSLKVREIESEGAARAGIGGYNPETAYGGQARVGVGAVSFIS